MRRPFLYAIAENIVMSTVATFVMPVLAPFLFVQILRKGGNDKREMVICLVLPMLFAPLLLLFAPAFSIATRCMRAWQGNNCPICLDPIDFSATRLRCNHEFHTACIESWFNQCRSCPLCRSKQGMDIRLKTWAMTLFEVPIK